MRKPASLLLLCLLSSLPASGQNWSLGAGTGPFVFGDFVRRTLQTGNEGGSGQQTTRLSASTRPGLAVDLERRINDYFAIRVEGTFTHAPIAIKGSSSSSGVALDAGKINIGTFSTPLLVRLNPHGTFQFHVMGGPAYALYDISRQSNASGSLAPFTGTRGRWGASFGGGVSWNWTKRFAVEGQLTDITTSSPFKRSDFATGGFSRVQIPRTRNVHTTIGLRYHF